MEPNKTFRIIVIVATVSTLVTIFTPVQSNGSFAARSLLSVSPSSNPPSISDSPSPAPTPANFPASSPAEIHIGSPAASPEAPAESISPSSPPTGTELDTPAPPPADSVSPTNPLSVENLVGSSSSGKTLMNSATNILSQSLQSLEPLLSPEVKTICAKTDSPQLCESSVGSLLTAQIKLDTSSVLVLAIKASINVTKAAMSIVDKVAASDCQELYDDAMANLEDAITAVESRDIATVNTNLSAAMTDFTTCNDGFEESGEPNPLADVSETLTKMVSNSLAISTLIK